MNPLLYLAGTLAIPEVIKGIGTLVEDAYEWLTEEEPTKKDPIDYNSIKEKEDL